MSRGGHHPRLNDEAKIKLNLLYADGLTLKEVAETVGSTVTTVWNHLDEGNRERAKLRNPKHTIAEIPINTRFGRLVTISEPYFQLPGQRQSRIDVLCDCGRTKTVLSCNLLNPDNTLSCGCRQRELTIERNRSYYLGDDHPRGPSKYFERCIVLQFGLCLWCDKQLTTGRIDVDHCHYDHSGCKDGKTCYACVRGAVHYHCNLDIIRWDWAFQQGLQGIPDKILTYLTSRAFEPSDKRE